MSVWTDFRDGALAGGLAQVLGVNDDDASNTGSGTAPAAGGGTTTDVEKVAPEPQLQDKDFSVQGVLMSVTQNQILGVTAALVALIGLVYLIRK